MNLLPNVSLMSLQTGFLKKKKKCCGELKSRSPISLNQNVNPLRNVFPRPQGSLRLVLNTQLWSGMTVVRANSKSIRLTCLDDDGTPRIYLIQVIVG